MGIIGLLNFLFLYLIQNFQLEIALADAIINSAILIVIAFSLWYPTNYIKVENYSIHAVVLINLLLIIITTSLWFSFAYSTTVTLFPAYNQLYLSTLSIRLIIGTLLISILIILNYTFIFYNNLKTKTFDESKFTSLITEAKLKTLKYQINPHFIFNSLNSISSLTISNPEKAQEMTINLSNFLRKILAVNDKKKVPLQEEIKNIKLYLQIEKVRFEDRLEFNLDLSEDCKDKLIPNMILQPLIENSIKHGVYESENIISVNLTCKQNGNYLELHISNNYDAAYSNPRGEGIGLQNINSRLKLIYNKSNLISIKKNDNIFTVILLIPVEKYNVEENN